MLTQIINGHILTPQGWLKDGSDTSTRGPCWTDLWFTGCAARRIAGYLSRDRISAESI
jgi:hypothetical protein